MDKSNGYERIASEFLMGWGTATNGIGKSRILKWSKTIKRGSGGKTYPNIMYNRCNLTYKYLLYANTVLAQFE